MASREGAQGKDSYRPTQSALQRVRGKSTNAR